MGSLRGIITSMNDDQLDDLKQFITATISQGLADVATKDDIANMATKDDIAAIRAEMATKDDLVQLKSELSTQIQDLDLKLDTIAETLNEHLEDHEQRITTLEQQPSHL